MCFYTHQTKEAKVVQERFNAKIDEPSLFHPQSVINGFNFPLTPVIIDEIAINCKFAQANTDK